jgi:hypothetical protein
MMRDVVKALVLALLVPLIPLLIAGTMILEDDQDELDYQDI